MSRFLRGRMSKKIGKICHTRGLGALGMRWGHDLGNIKLNVLLKVEKGARCRKIYSKILSTGGDSEVTRNFCKDRKIKFSVT